MCVCVCLCVCVCVCVSVCAVSSHSQVSLKERIRAGGLRPMLELGVTPSHISVMVEGEEVG